MASLSIQYDIICNYMIFIKVKIAAKVINIVDSSRIPIYLSFSKYNLNIFIYVNRKVLKCIYQSYQILCLQHLLFGFGGNWYDHTYKELWLQKIYSDLI